MRKPAAQRCSAPARLCDCSTPALQLAWIKRALLSGRTVSDWGLWLGGVDNPGRRIARLRKQGLVIKTTRKFIVDAANEKHKDLAWVLAPQLASAQVVQP